MKVQGTADSESLRLVQDYDNWYDEWSVDDLMRERMSSKDKRRGGGGTVVSRRGSAATPVSSRSTPAATLNGRRATRQLRDSVLNPRLDRNVKGEPLSRSATPASALSLTGSLHRAYAPPMQHSWPATSYTDSPMKVESIGSSMSNDSYELNPEPEYQRPARRSTRRRLSESNGSLINEDDWVEMDDTITDATKLKGVQWPGMALFDSATPEMKRKRNQKKDYSVVEQLKATSEFVEPTEMIFDVDGNLRKQRVITGNPDQEDDESPLSGEATPEPELHVKKRTARRPRPALVEKNVNTGRVLRRRSSHHPPPRTRRGPYYDGPFEEDDDLTYGQPKPKKRTGLSIHRDNTGPDITFNEPAPPLSYLTTGFRNPFQPSQTPLQHTQPTYSQSNYGRGHQRLPSFTFGGQPLGASFRPAAAGHNMPTQNYSSFGHLNTNTLFQNGPFQMHNGQSAFAAFQQQFGVAQHQPFGNEQNIFQNHSNGTNQSQGGWDMFTGLGHQDGGMASNMDTSFQAGAELNPLFFSSNQPTPPEDDEGTISPPPSER
ncbi:hypothetical protein LTR36_002169 [Oleoguttula mirabilis]|uniref:Uncharacterized protein n=1 Tax=Oleoguttula mirabilis TaxID=1507867 RepID=A0AAV9JL34_9PEZI|nr:hypothetical protein LTR36_002169 [Oleoguttula mirabilis]